MGGNLPHFIVVARSWLPAGQIFLEEELSELKGKVAAGVRAEV